MNLKLPANLKKLAIPDSGSGKSAKILFNIEYESLSSKELQELGRCVKKESSNVHFKIKFDRTACDFSAPVKAISITSGGESVFVSLSTEVDISLIGEKALWPMVWISGTDMSDIDLEITILEDAQLTLAE